MHAVKYNLATVTSIQMPSKKKSDVLIQDWLKEPKPEIFRMERVVEWVTAVKYPYGKGRGHSTNFTEIRNRMAELGHPIARTTVNGLARLTQDNSDNPKTYLEPKTIKAIAAYTRPDRVDEQEWLEATAHWMGAIVPDSSNYDAAGKRIDELESRLKRLESSIMPKPLHPLTIYFQDELFEIGVDVRTPEGVAMVREAAGDDGEGEHVARIFFGLEAPHPEYWARVGTTIEALFKQKGQPLDRPWNWNRIDEIAVKLRSSSSYDRAFSQE